MRKRKQKKAEKKQALRDSSLQDTSLQDNAQSAQSDTAQSGTAQPNTGFPSTLGELKASGWQSKSVKDELRQNAILRIRANEDLFPGIWGYADSVFPSLEHAILAKHDIIFLGERGQAKTRIIRQLMKLMDPYLPIVAGSEINDDPYNPVSSFAKATINAKGDDTPIAWRTPDDRFAEKLATPDTSIADLIGEVDPIKVAEGRYLSDELTLHYGLVPRVNRGIFAINELPDLAERIQVGLLNVMEERDIQVRGYRICLPLDILLVASANPEDYTNRGRIITPLKDRFGSQIRTHYPKTIETERKIMEQEVEPIAALATSNPSGEANASGEANPSGEASDAPGDFAVQMPNFMENILIRLSQDLRESPSIDQSSGVSVRLTIANYEVLMASATRRMLEMGDAKAVPRISDLDALISSMSGKVEFDAMETAESGTLFDLHIKQAILSAFSNYVKAEELHSLIDRFEGEGTTVINTGEDISLDEYLVVITEIPELKIGLRHLGLAEEDLADGALVASGVEFILEGLHLNRMLNKHSTGKQNTYEAKRDTRYQLGA